MLASCYRRFIDVACEKGAVSLALPSISTGIYGYPIELAARLAVEPVQATVANIAELHQVVFCCFSASDLAVYEGARKKAYAARGQ